MKIFILKICLACGFSFVIAGVQANICLEHGFREITRKTGNPTTWGTLFSAWGKKNLTSYVVGETGNTVLRVHFPAGTYDPGSMIAQGLPVGGTGFAILFDGSAATCATLTYRLRFSNDFDFVRGGKLPGLAGGVAHTYPRLPRGINGYTARLMWRELGAGEIYAYLRTTPRPTNYYGTSIGRGSFHFSKGEWHTVTESIRLNDPTMADGVMHLTLDGKLVIDQNSLLIRDREDVFSDGFIFESFFGGNDVTWATPKAAFIEFTAFEYRGYAK
ncbi:MAG: polysaccharide lyase [Rhodocyclaceae bacterium]|nr:MAG: polysaccharide lyase [Rhodocyclaceae bacterium]CAG0930877.1 hypothetical protein RHDC3_01671 [Rhodocyclaceae bacterium]